MPKFTPFGNTLVVKMAEKESVSPGGIALIGNAQKRPWVATVIAVGPGQTNGFGGERTPCFAKVGDQLLVNRNAVMELEYNGETVQYIAEGDVILRIDED